MSWFLVAQRGIDCGDCDSIQVKCQRLIPFTFWLSPQRLIGDRGGGDACYGRGRNRPDRRRPFAAEPLDDCVLHDSDHGYERPLVRPARERPPDERPCPSDAPRRRPEAELLDRDEDALDPLDEARPRPAEDVRPRPLEDPLVFPEDREFPLVDRRPPLDELLTFASSILPRQPPVSSPSMRMYALNRARSARTARLT
jgi:hypothetical protein